MKLILGLFIVFASVIGGYMMAHGALSALWQPNEFIIIGGGAFGAFIVSHPPKVLLAVLKGMPSLLRGASYTKQHYLDLLALLYDLFTKARKEGLMALEDDVEEPKNSEIFNRYPRVMADHHAVEFIADYLRLMVGGSMNPHELENLMDLELETHHREVSLPSDSVQNTADGLPAFGIVAAVMGVVITMGAMDQPPEVLGHHIAAALVGTFLGVLLAYGFAGPLANALGHKAREEAKFLETAKVAILATLNGYTPLIAVEFGRKVVYSTERPGFLELEEYIKRPKQQG